MSDVIDDGLVRSRSDIWGAIDPVTCVGEDPVGISPGSPAHRPVLDGQAVHREILGIACRQYGVV